MDPAQAIKPIGDADNPAENENAEETLNLEQEETPKPQRTVLFFSK